LPVVVVPYHPESQRCYWQLINSSTLVETAGGNWKVLIPQEQVLDGSARELLTRAAEGDPYVLRIRELQLARPWMQRLQEGERLVVEVEEWINKTSGRGSITLAVDREDGQQPTPIAEWTVFLGFASYAEAIPQLFAWAHVTVHQETYDDAEYAEYEAGRRGELRPYTNAADEVDHWRLELTLNDLGRAYLLVDKFATNGGTQLTP
jgi:hypothetical protein